MVACYRAWFEKGLTPGSRANLEASLVPLGQNVDAVLARAEAPEVDQAVIANTEDARRRGIFGAPSFTVGDELFWRGRPAGRRRRLGAVRLSRPVAHQLEIVRAR